MTNADNVRVLLVETDEDALEIFQKTIERSFPDIVCQVASNPADAERLFSTHRYEIVICDLLLPTTCGRRLLGHARLQPEQPVIFISGEVAAKRRLPHPEVQKLNLCQVPGTPIVLKDFIATVEEALVSVRRPASSVDN
ncbi:hypothetical protein GMST_04760 [Geomonas silvestris]|uniref:Response regulatory domain-containing protein n=1 Tax=Geomonas silvestris TaxID=2740184 RepID=A0A6V8MDT7_9BACT|nr:response regulator [Geomonas silvestris]GFO58151.1 hypothetical protein GMST_04760 [Geomonas silvestris]